MLTSGNPAEILPNHRVPHLAKLTVRDTRGCILRRGGRSAQLKRFLRTVPSVISDRPGIGERKENEDVVEKGTYQWTKQWYPLRVLQQLEQDRPNHAKLLGKDLVVWKDGSGRWNCFADMCPHRMAPLSEGRVEKDGNLLCAYHAWRFDGDGKCVKVPQAADAREEQTICSSTRACAKVYPTQELQGILWVWGESGPQASLESKEKAPLIVEELEDPSLKKQIPHLNWVMFDLAYSWDYFMENVLDPAHVPVSHHGLIGSRYQEKQQFSPNPKMERSAQGGFVSEGTGYLGRTSIEFQPPCRVRIDQYTKSGDLSGLVLLATPTEPGRCVHIGAQLSISSANSSKSLDLVLLHRQDAYRRTYTRDKSFMQAYNMQHWDILVGVFREWFQKDAGGAIPWPHGLSEKNAAVLPHEELFDVWRAHTRTCSICKTALKNLKRIRIILGAVALFAGVQYVQNSRVPSTGILKQSSALVVVLVLSGVLLALNKLIGKYYRHEFYHADNN